MPEYLEGPNGLIRVAADVVEADFAPVMLATPRGQEVSLMFIRPLEVPDGDHPDVTHEAVAHIFMPRENYERLVSMLPAGPELWREQGL